MGLVGSAVAVPWGSLDDFKTVGLESATARREAMGDRGGEDPRES